MFHPLLASPSQSFLLYPLPRYANSALVECKSSHTSHSSHSPHSPHPCPCSRTVYEVVTGEPLGALPLQEVRGLEGVREATVTIKPNPEGPLHLDHVSRWQRSHGGWEGE